jgi:hypothetical protein
MPEQGEDPLLLVLRRRKAGPSFLRFAVLFGGVVDAMFVRMLRCDMRRSLWLRRHMRRHRRSPTVATLPAGRDPRPIGACDNIGTNGCSLCSESPVHSARKMRATRWFLPCCGVPLLLTADRA